MSRAGVSLVEVAVALGLAALALRVVLPVAARPARPASPLVPAMEWVLHDVSRAVRVLAPGLPRGARGGRRAPTLELERGDGSRVSYAPTRGGDLLRLERSSAPAPAKGGVSLRGGQPAAPARRSVFPGVRPLFQVRGGRGRVVRVRLGHGGRWLLSAARVGAWLEGGARAPP